MNPADTITDAALGLEAGARVLTKTFNAPGVVNLVDVERSYGGRCDVVLVAVPHCEGLTFESRLWRELGGESVESQ